MNLNSSQLDRKLYACKGSQGVAKEREGQGYVLEAMEKHVSRKKKQSIEMTPNGNLNQLSIVKLPLGLVMLVRGIGAAESVRSCIRLGDCVREW